MNCGFNPPCSSTFPFDSVADSKATGKRTVNLSSTTSMEKALLHTAMRLSITSLFETDALALAAASSPLAIPAMLIISTVGVADRAAYECTREHIPAALCCCIVLVHKLLLCG